MIRSCCRNFKNAWSIRSAVYRFGEFGAVGEALQHDEPQYPTPNRLEFSVSDSSLCLTLYSHLGTKDDSVDQADVNFGQVEIKYIQEIEEKKKIVENSKNKGDQEEDYFRKIKEENEMLVEKLRVGYSRT